MFIKEKAAKQEMNGTKLTDKNLITDDRAHDGRRARCDIVYSDS